MTLEEMELVLRHWESLDGLSWSDEVRDECISIVSELEWTIGEWMAFLVPVPKNVGERYRKAMTLLLEKGLINEEDFNTECGYSMKAAPATLARNGKVLMDWYRYEEQHGFPMKIAA